VQAKESRGPILLPLLLVGIGVVLLLNNFLLLNDFNVAGLLPLLLVVAGAQILLRGDLVPGTDSRTFGITRGSVQSGTLEINAGEIDVDLRAVQKEGRLIVGQYASDSRPALQVDETHAHLKLNRDMTPWLSFVDWQMALARDLPWQVYVSTSLGQVNADLSGLIMQDVLIATGIGDIRVICPQETFAPVVLRSTLGNIHVITPRGQAATITVSGGRMFTVRADETRYHQVEPGVFSALEVDNDLPPVEITITGSFGDAYLA
jgi:hypothetical protein